MSFSDTLERAYTHISRYPNTGSQRYANELNLPRLGSWSMTRYSYLVFYIEQSDLIDLWRVLHGHRYIAVWIAEP
jgi:toxin ParE1/3/4